MNIAITGASGLVGRALQNQYQDDDVYVLSRSKPTSGRVISWNPSAPFSESKLAEMDVIIHLAGEPVAGMWSKEKKKRIRKSRVEGTQHLVNAMNEAGCTACFICASAIGYYGSNPNSVDESSKRGDGFLAEVVEAWEAASRNYDGRVVNARFGIVLSPEGGALNAMLPAFKFGGGGPMGDGRQFMSWVSLRDAVRALSFLCGERTIEGPVNVVSPSAVSNAEFTNILGKVLKRPTFFRVPKSALKLIGGDAANEMLLASQNVTPKVLTEAGFTFQDTDLEATFRGMLK